MSSRCVCYTKLCCTARQQHAMPPASLPNGLAIPINALSQGCISKLVLDEHPSTFNELQLPTSHISKHVHRAAAQWSTDVVDSCTDQWRLLDAHRPRAPHLFMNSLSDRSNLTPAHLPVDLHCNLTRFALSISNVDEFRLFYLLLPH